MFTTQTTWCNLNLKSANKRNKLATKRTTNTKQFEFANILYFLTTSIQNLDRQLCENNLFTKPSVCVGREGSEESRRTFSAGWRSDDPHSEDLEAEGGVGWTGSNPGGKILDSHLQRYEWNNFSNTSPSTKKFPKKPAYNTPEAVTSMLTKCCHFEWKIKLNLK